MSVGTGGDAWLRRAPTITLVAVGASITAAWLATLAVDVFDLFGSRTALFEQRDSEYPYLFYHLFAEGRPVEWLQWGLLVVAAVTVAVCAGRWLQWTPAACRRLSGLALVLGVLVIKDAGNPRHVASATVASWLGSGAGMATELVILGGVGGLALAALGYSWRVLRSHRTARNLMVAGYGVYALAGAMSATSDWWYRDAGHVLVHNVFAGRLLSPPGGMESGWLSWTIVDSLIEESVEAVAAAFLLAAAFAMLRDLLPRADGPGHAEWALLTHVDPHHLETPKGSP